MNVIMTSFLAFILLLSEITSTVPAESNPPVIGTVQITCTYRFSIKGCTRIFDKRCHIIMRIKRKFIFKV